MANLFFKYRKGGLYEAGLFGIRTLIIGESHFCDKTNCPYWSECTDVIKKDSSPFNLLCLYSDASSLADTTVHDLNQHVSGVTSITSYKNFEYFVFERFGGMKRPRDVYDKVAFVDFLQFFAPRADIDKKWISDRDYNAMEEVINELEPELIIIWGTNAGREFKKRDTRPSGVVGADLDYVFVHNIAGKDRLVLNTYHPSDKYQYFTNDKDRLETQMKLLLNA